MEATEYLDLCIQNGQEPGRFIRSLDVVTRKALLNGALKDYISPRQLLEVEYAPVGSFYYKLHEDRTLDPEYDLRTVYMYYHEEPIIARAIDKRVKLMFKNGWSISGSKKKIVNEINNRLDEICEVAKTSVESFLKEVVHNLFKYSNVFLYKKRDEANSSGKTFSTKKRNKVIPIATYQVISPLVMKPRVDKVGKIVQWIQYDANGNIELNKFSPDDIIHMFINRETGFIFGKPMILDVIQDVDALRRIEENVQILIAQHIFPLYQYTVGTEEKPAVFYPNGVSEVDYVKQQVTSLPTQGIIFTPERHNIEAKSHPDIMDVSEYLAYFKTRVYLGLGVSSVDVGESDTSNRGTAITVSQNLKDAVGDDQTTFAELFNFHIIRELLLESQTTIDYRARYKDISLRFSTIDTDEKIKKETHGLAMFQGNGITNAELRDTLDLSPLTEEQLLNETLLGLKFKMESYLAALAASMNPPTTKTATGGEKVIPQATESNPVISQALNIVRPENSTGVMLGPKKTTN